MDGMVYDRIVTGPRAVQRWLCLRFGTVAARVGDVCCAKDKDGYYSS